MPPAVEDLSLLTITSKSMRNLIECYRVTTFSSRGLGVHSRAHGVMDVERQAEWLARYKKLGKTKTGLFVSFSGCLRCTSEMCGHLQLNPAFLHKSYCTVLILQELPNTSQLLLLLLRSCCYYYDNDFCCSYCY